MFSSLLWSFCVCKSVPLVVLEIKSGLSAGLLPPGVYNFLSLLIVDVSAPRGRTLDGGIARSLAIEVLRVTPQEKAGRPIGPIHPALLFSKLLVFLAASDVSDKTLCFGFPSSPVLWGNLSVTLSPSNFEMHECFVFVFVVFAPFFSTWPGALPPTMIPRVQSRHATAEFLPGRL